MYVDNILKAITLNLIFMKDGLYQVTTSYFCAGFIMKDNKVAHIAPILRAKIEYWKTIAVWICY